MWNKCLVNAPHNLFVLQFSASYTIIETKIFLKLLIGIPIISRCCSAISILCLKTIEQSSLAKMFRENSGIQHKVSIIFVLVLAVVFTCRYAGCSGLIVSAAVITGFTAALAYSYKNLKGVSGDLAGFGLVIGELCGLFAMAAV